MLVAGDAYDVCPEGKAVGVPSGRSILMASNKYAGYRDDLAFQDDQTQIYPVILTFDAGQ